MTTPIDHFASERLVYRAAESPADDDFFFNLERRAIDYINSNTSLGKPQSRENTKKGYQDYIMNKALIGVVICLKAQGGVEPVPVGTCHLEPIEGPQMQHRSSRIGINIASEHRGKGYGSEAIRWLVNWGFDSAGLHRIGIDALEYNEGAFRLYERLGFKVEGRTRQAFYQYGRFWDDIQLGMLEDEWREMRDKDKGRGSS